MIVSGPDGIVLPKLIYSHLPGYQDSNFIQVLRGSHISGSERSTLSQCVVSLSLLDWTWLEI